MNKSKENNLLEVSQANLATRTIDDHWTTNDCQMDAIKTTLNKADTDQARFFGHQAVREWLISWGTPEEIAPKLP